MHTNNRQSFLYIDGDNFDCSYFENILCFSRSVSDTVNATVFCWNKSPNFVCWKQLCCKLDVKFIETTSLTKKKKKSTTDNVIFYHIMSDLFKIDAKKIIICSNDSDFYYVAKLLTERGKQVFGAIAPNVVLKYKNVFTKSVILRK